MKKFDEFADFVRSFFASVREELVERGWFGRSVTSEMSSDKTYGHDGPLASEIAIFRSGPGTEPTKHPLDVTRRSFAEQLGWDRAPARDDMEHGIDH
jgi:hypothetical protein